MTSVVETVKSCALRGRSEGDWKNSPHHQRLEINQEISNCVSSVTKDFLIIMGKEKIDLPEELKGKRFRIRKLTPRECFRLMGCEDKSIDLIQKTGLSKSSQYKLAGNSIVVDVLFHIFRKLLIETDLPDHNKGEAVQMTLF